MSCGKRGLQDCVLCICARYEWSDIPENGKSLQQEDVALLDAPGRNMLINFAAGQEVKPSKLCDLSRIEKPPLNHWDRVALTSHEATANTTTITTASAAELPKPDFAGPSHVQSPGQPYVFYHQIQFVETKASGYRMSGCLAVLDASRLNLLTTCDWSVRSFRHLKTLPLQIALELRPAISQLSDKIAHDGFLYTHPDSSGPVLSWLRAESTFGWSKFPHRMEESTIFLVGKNRDSDQREPLATARSNLILADGTSNPAAAFAGEVAARESDQFWGAARLNHSNASLDVAELQALYSKGNEAYKPTYMKKVCWMSSYFHCDVDCALYHGKVPEILWDINTQAGGPFADLLRTEPDPQALVVTILRRFQTGTFYDVLSFLDKDLQKAVYCFMPQGSLHPEDCLLAVCALYNWHQVPEQGCTLRSEDFEMVGENGRHNFIRFAAGSGTKPSNVQDFSRLA